MSTNFEIKLLKHCSHHITPLSEMWFSELGKKWIPEASTARAEKTFQSHLNDENLPMTFVACIEGQACGMVSLRDNDGIREDLKPWLGSLIVAPEFRRLGLGAKLIEVTKNQARLMGYEKLFLFALDPVLPKWYNQLGWEKIAMDKLYHHPVTVMEINL